MKGDVFADTIIIFIRGILGCASYTLEASITHDDTDCYYKIIGCLQMPEIKREGGLSDYLLDDTAAAVVWFIITLIAFTATFGRFIRRAHNITEHIIGHIRITVGSHRTRIATRVDGPICYGISPVCEQHTANSIRIAEHLAVNDNVIIIHLECVSISVNTYHM